MGAGDIFRGVAQGLLGAGSSAANYALERDAELRKQRWMMEQIQAQKERRQLLPIEEEKIRAEINALNRRNTGGGGGGGGKGTAIDQRVESIIQAEEAARGNPYNPRDRGKRKAQLLGVSLFKPSSQDYGDEEMNPLEPIPNSMPGFIPRQQRPTTTEPVSAAAPSPAPSPKSLPPRKPGETQEQYSARTGIQFK